MGFRRDWFWIGCAFEAGMAGLGLLLAWVRGGLAEARWRFDLQTLGWSLILVLPLAVALMGMDRSSSAAMGRIRAFMNERVGPALGSLSMWEFAALSLAAGVGEEILFRLGIQAGLAGWIGEGPALAATAILFGLAHRVTTAYAVVAGLMGAYLGWAWLVLDNLAIPILAHAGYDFFALWFLFKRAPRRG